MEEKRESVFDRLDSIEAQQTATQEQNAQIIQLLNNLNKKQANTSNNKTTNSNQQLSSNELLVNFIKTSKREHIWFGSQEEFEKSKLFVILMCVGIIGLGIISTILTGLATGLYYCPFSIIENVWLIFVIIIMLKTIGLKKKMLDFDLMDHAITIYMQDADGVWRDTSKEKKRYSLSRRFAYAAAAFNVIMIWGLTRGTVNIDISIAATIFEIVFVGLSIGFIFVYSNLDCMYGNFILFTGKNPFAEGTLRLVYDVMANTTELYDEYKKKYKDMI